MKDGRQRDLAKIHIARKQLDVADDIYRAKLQEVGGVTSSKDLSILGRAKLLAWFESKGFKGTAAKTDAKRPKRPTPAPENAPLCKKIRAQLISLGRLPDAYADGISKKAFNVDFYEWCTPDQLRKLSVMLAFEQKRQGADQGPAR
jgi:phage gp16-like protein